MLPSIYNFYIEEVYRKSYIIDFYAIFGTTKLCPSEPPGSAAAVHLAAESIINRR